MDKTPLIFGACAAALFSLISAACAYPIYALPVGPDDAIPGKALFERRCTGCHTLDQNRVGPRLAGVYGRKSGSVPDFPYSTELKSRNCLGQPIARCLAHRSRHACLG